MDDLTLSSAVPEPPTWPILVLAGLAITGLTAAHRRSRASRRANPIA
jgi:hypothetical protein